MKSTFRIKLINGRSVHPDFLNCIQTAVEERLTALSPYTRYTLRKICGDSYWSLLDDGEKRMAGWCMLHMVTKGELPFSIAESRHEYPVYYLLDPPSGADSLT